MFLFSYGFYRELFLIGGVASIAVLFGWLTQLWTVSLVAAIVTYLSIHYYFFHRFFKWLKAPRSFSLKSGLGIWSVIYPACQQIKQAHLQELSLLEEQTKKFRLANMLLPDALVALSPDDRIEWLNSAAETMLGFRQDDLGKRIEYFLRDPVFVEYLHQTDHEDSIEFYSTVNSYQLLSVQVLPYYHNHKLLLARDITEINKMVQMRRDFVANASHELRTPLTVLSGYLEMMSDLVNDGLKQWKLPIENMQAQSERMKHIIEDLLTLSSIETKASMENQAWVDVVDILQGIKLQAEQLSQGRHKIDFSIESSAKVFGYQEPLVSVFMNLVSNAIRYTPDGGKIFVRWFEEGGKPCFSVKDTGIGIAREDIPRLTERFFRVDTARSRETGGTGLGLAIVKHVLDLHRAEMDIQSRLYVGSTFTVRFPVQQAEEAVSF